MGAHSQALPVAWEDSVSLRLLYPIDTYTVCVTSHLHISVLACCLAFALWSLHKLHCYYHSPLLVQLRCDQTVPWKWEHYPSSAAAALSSLLPFSFGVLLLLEGTQPLFLWKLISQKWGPWKYSAYHTNGCAWSSSNLPLAMSILSYKICLQYLAFFSHFSHSFPKCANNSSSNMHMHLQDALPGRG